MEIRGRIALNFESWFFRVFAVEMWVRGDVRCFLRSDVGSDLRQILSRGHLMEPALKKELLVV